MNSYDILNFPKVSSEFDDFKIFEKINDNLKTITLKTGLELTTNRKTNEIKGGFESSVSMMRADLNPVQNYLSDNEKN